MEGTFKSCPKSYYQLYNIMGKEKNTDLIIPLIFILMSQTDPMTSIIMYLYL